MFRDKFASLKAKRMKKVADDVAVLDEKLESYVNKMAEWGVTIEPENAKPATKEDAWTSIILLVKSPTGQTWVEGTLMAINDKQEAITALIEKIKEVNNEFAEFGSYFSQVSDTKLKEYELVILPKVRYKGMTGGQQVATWLYGAMQSFYGDAVISELDDIELEKIAKQLTAEFGIKVREMLASLRK